MKISMRKSHTGRRPNGKIEIFIMYSISIMRRRRKKIGFFSCNKIWWTVQKVLWQILPNHPIKNINSYLIFCPILPLIYFGNLTSYLFFGINLTSYLFFGPILLLTKRATTPSRRCRKLVQSVEVQWLPKSERIAERERICFQPIRISWFPWQPVGILKFRFRKVFFVPLPPPFQVWCPFIILILVSVYTPSIHDIVKMIPLSASCTRSVQHMSPAPWAPNIWTKPSYRESLLSVTGATVLWWSLGMRYMYV